MVNEFRRAEAGERPAVADLMRRLNLEDPSEERHGGANAANTFRLLDEDPGRGGIFVALDGETVVAYALMIAYLSNEFGGLLTYLDEFYVLPPYRNQGLGGRFLAFLEEEYRRRGFRRMVLEVLDGNEGAARFYHRHGFARERRALMGKKL